MINHLPESPNRSSCYSLSITSKHNQMTDFNPYYISHTHSTRIQLELPTAHIGCSVSTDSFNMKGFIQDEQGIQWAASALRAADALAISISSYDPDKQRLSSFCFRQLWRAVERINCLLILQCEYRQHAAQLLDLHSERCCQKRHAGHKT